MHRLLKSIVPALAVALVLGGCAQPRDAATSAVESDRSSSMSAPATSASASVEADPCAAASETPVIAGGIDGAMGERFVALIVTNCGSTPLDLSGYPEVDVLDEDGAPVGVSARPDAGPDGTTPAAAVPVTVSPGGTAYVSLRWRNTTGTESAPVTGAYARISLDASTAPQDVPLRLDLGTTGALYISGWVAQE